MRLRNKASLLLLLCSSLGSLYEQTAGMAYYRIPDNLTPHTNMNPSGEAQAKFLYFAHYKPHEPRK